MKYLIARTSTLLLLSLVWLGTTAQAQSSAPVIKVTIPFEFTFGDRTYPAGDYSLARPEQHLLALRDSRGRTIDWLLTQGVDSRLGAASTKVRFESSEGRHLLTEVWLQQETSGERYAPVPDGTKMVAHRSTEGRVTADESRAFTGTKR